MARTPKLPNFSSEKPFSPVPFNEAEIVHKSRMLKPLHEQHIDFILPSPEAAIPTGRSILPDVLSVVLDRTVTKP